MGLFTEQGRWGKVPNDRGCLVMLIFMCIGGAVCIVGGLAAIGALIYYAGRGMEAW